MHILYIHTSTYLSIVSLRLTDESVLVRKNTLTVLSHLILNDMLKVKGQISLIAMCLEDSEPRIADLAKLFFHELAKKVCTWVCLGTYIRTYIYTHCCDMVHTYIHTYV